MFPKKQSIHYCSAGKYEQSMSEVTDKGKCVSIRRSTIELDESPHTPRYDPNELEKDIKTGKEIKQVNTKVLNQDRIDFSTNPELSIPETPDSQETNQQEN